MPTQTTTERPRECCHAVPKTAPLDRLAAAPCRVAWLAGSLAAIVACGDASAGDRTDAMGQERAGSGPSPTSTDLAASDPTPTTANEPPLGPTAPSTPTAPPPAPTSNVAANPHASPTDGADPDGSAPEQAPIDDWPADCDYRYTIRAHAPDGDRAFEVSPDAEYTMAFFSKPPWQGSEVQFVKARPLVDNGRILHHWTLYAVNDGSLRDGEVRGGPGQPTPLKGVGEQYVIGGTRGTTEDLELPADVGLRVPSGPNVMQRLEVHYVNYGNDPALDASGFEVCMTAHKRPKEAAAHWLGTLLINVPASADGEVTTTCHPLNQAQPVHIMSVAPHMHQAGIHATMVIERGDGTHETLIDQPYDFQHQEAYTVPEDRSAPDVVIEPGDAIRSTCRYRNENDTPLLFGERSIDEMCFMVVFAWPTGHLVNGSLLGGLVGATPDITCLEP